MRQFINIITEAQKPTRSDLQQRQLAQLLRTLNVSTTLFGKATSVELEAWDSGADPMEITLLYSTTTPLHEPAWAHTPVEGVRVGQRYGENNSTIKPLFSDPDDIEIGRPGTRTVREWASEVTGLTWRKGSLASVDYDYDGNPWYVASAVPQLTELLNHFHQMQDSIPWVRPPNATPGWKTLKLK